MGKVSPTFIDIALGICVWPVILAADTRIFRLFFLTSGVTSFAAQFAMVSFEKISAASQANSATSNRRF